MLAQEDRKRIEERAYELWDRDGRPAGRDLEYWLRAESEVEAGEPAAKPRKPRAKRPAATATRARAADKVTSIEKGRPPGRK